MTQEVKPRVSWGTWSPPTPRPGDVWVQTLGQHESLRWRWDGKVWRLEGAVAIMGSAQLGAQLSDDEAAAIATFLGSLTGQQPRVSYPVLPPHTAETPLPDVGVAGATH